MNFEVTRLENDERLLPQIEKIRTGENIEVLVPFAKAYLGMFYVIDSELPAKEKVRLLANEALAEAVFQGFSASLTRTSVPSIEEIGSAMAEQTEFAEGYVMLAGVDLVAADSLSNIMQLPQASIEAVIGFHFSNKINHKNCWYDYILAEQKAEIAEIIAKYWEAMLDNNATFLPGIDLILGDIPDTLVIEKNILPLLQNWKSCKDKILFRLLLLAFKYSKTDELLQVAEVLLADEEKLSEKAHLYWIATAYFISPARYYAKINNYVGRVKIKVMPLLDFMTRVMAEKESNIYFNDKLIADLLRLVAPIFPPQHHVYGSLGGLDINSKNVMRLFYSLMCSEDKDVKHELKVLRKVRVMKIYSGVIDYILDFQVHKTNDSSLVIPGFEDFIASLFDNDLLQGKSNRFDLR